MNHFKKIFFGVLALFMVCLAILYFSEWGNEKTYEYFSYDISGKERQKYAAKYQKEIEEKNAALRAMPQTQIEIIETNFDFGNISAGEKVKHVFKIKNIGHQKLVVGDVKAGCGCTVPSFPEKAISVGDTADIEVEFDSSHKDGIIEKNVLVYANVENSPFPLSFTAHIKP